jgi:hypothetical protein
MLFAVEDDAKRFTGDDDNPGLGSPEEEKDAMHRLWRDIDGHDTGWLTLFKQLAIELIVCHRAWVIVDQVEDKAQVKVWPASAVPNWKFKDGQLNEVLITEWVDTRASIKDKGKIEQQWVLYDLEGWQRWRKDDRGEPTAAGAKTMWGRTFKTADGRSVLPIYPAELPLRRNVGWTLAKKANAIFNKESERDNLQRAGGFPILLLAASDTQYTKLTTELKKGARALQDDPKTTKSHQFIGPDVSPATSMSETLTRKVEEFYVVAFREYGDAAREKTATEVSQDVAAGVGAFLQMLKAAVDDAENQAMLRIAQIEYPQDERRWYVNRVERSETFVPTDIEATIKALKEKYVPADQPIPLGLKGMLSMAKQAAEYDGIEFDENEMKAAIMVGEVKKIADLFDKLPFTPEMKVELLLSLCVALGYVKPEEMEELEDESEGRKIDRIREEMLTQAENEQQAKELMAQPLDMGPGSPVPGKPKPKPKELLAPKEGDE